MRIHASTAYLLLPCLFLLTNDLWGKAAAKPKIKLRTAFNVSFRKPVFMTPYPIKYKKLPRLYAVLEQSGTIKLVSRRGNAGSKQFAYLLNIKKKVCNEGSEEGLLGLAFSPDYKKDHRAYIYYSVCKPRKSIISRVVFQPNFLKAPQNINNLSFRSKEEIILKIKQPYSNHNGGMLSFNQKDHYLYIGTGDGGSGGDPYKNGQKLSTLLGKILRIDVSSRKGYKIPADNPFIRYKKAKPEIFAYGLRNPWRFSFDQQNRLLAGDVGQNKYEEVHIVKKGKNYGWNIMEGAHCYRSKKCSRKGLEIPEIEYNHQEGQCIIGGYIYYGQNIPALRGKYIFGDTTTGKIWYSSLKYRNQKKILMDTQHYISSFGLDENKEIYVIDLLGGIYQMIPSP